VLRGSYWKKKVLRARRGPQWLCTSSRLDSHSPLLRQGRQGCLWRAYIVQRERTQAESLLYRLIECSEKERRLKAYLAVGRPTLRFERVWRKRTQAESLRYSLTEQLFVERAEYFRRAAAFIEN